MRIGFRAPPRKLRVDAGFRRRLEACFQAQVLNMKSVDDSMYPLIFFDSYFGWLEYFKAREAYYEDLRESDEIDYDY
jgi:hypothetical protein